MKIARNLPSRLSKRLWVIFMCRRSLHSIVSSTRFSGFIVVLMLILTPAMGFIGEVEQKQKLAEEFEESDVNRNSVSLVGTIPRVSPARYYLALCPCRARTFLFKLN